MEGFKVKKIKDLLVIDSDQMVKESKDEGFRFIERLVNDYKNDSNTFHQLGESLYGVFNNEGVLVAIGGLNIDPFSTEETIGRLRRFYVLGDYRRNGLGSLLLERIISEAKDHYNVIVLHTDTEQADHFYQAFGFIKEARYPKTTHYFNL